MFTKHYLAVLMSGVLSLGALAPAKAETRPAVMVHNTGDQSPADSVSKDLSGHRRHYRYYHSHRRHHYHHSRHRHWVPAHYGWHNHHRHWVPGIWISVF